jgi:3-methyl-2-oxobutanoate hydroxymethyltransferase
MRRPPLRAPASAARSSATLVTSVTPSGASPTIGIGAGPQCDGQVLVLHDFLGLDSGHRRPKFVKDFLAGAGSVGAAVRAFADDVQAGRFPDAEHSYQ